MRRSRMRARVGSKRSPPAPCAPTSSGTGTALSIPRRSCVLKIRRRSFLRPTAITTCPASRTRWTSRRSPARWRAVSPSTRTSPKPSPWGTIWGTRPSGTSANGCSPRSIRLASGTANSRCASWTRWKRTERDSISPLKCATASSTTPRRDIPRRPRGRRSLLPTVSPT